MNKKFLALLACPVCQSELAHEKQTLSCEKCVRKYPILNGIPVFIQTIDETQTQLSLHKFQELYQEGHLSQKELGEFAKHKITEHFPMRDYLKSLPDKKHGRYLELGIGGSIAIKPIAEKGYSIYGIDFSLTALQLSQQIAALYKIPCYLVCADIAHPPFKDNVFDIVYGGGTLEHLENTQKTLNQAYRIMRPRGTIINTVPVVSISSLTYRQLSGNIPELPVLKSIFYFIHKKILKTKFMFTGYEKSFMPITMRKMHKKAGFKNVRTFRYEFTPQLPHIPVRLKPLLQKAEKYRPFWTAINVVGQKT